MKPQQKQKKNPDKIQKRTLKIGVYISTLDSKHPVVSNSLSVTKRILKKQTNKQFVSDVLAYILCTYLQLMKEKSK
jgi:hypothetical protein